MPLETVIVRDSIIEVVSVGTQGPPGPPSLSVGAFVTNEGEGLFAGPGGYESYPSVFHVMSYGAACDGSTDDTTAVQDAVNAAKAASGARAVYIPATTKITATIDVDANHISIIGPGKEIAGLKQFTPNIPILRWTDDAFAVLNSVHIDGLTLEHAAQATAATPLQYGIMIRSASGGAAVDLGGAYLWHIGDIAVKNAYVGIGAWATGGGQIGFWGCTFDSLWFFDTKHRALELSVGGGGWPSNNFGAVHVLNYNMRRSDGGGNYADAEAIYLVGCIGLQMDVLNIEDWVDSAITLISCDGSVFGAVRFERHDIRTNGISVMQLGATGAINIEAFTIDVKCNQPGLSFIINAFSTSHLDIGAVTAGRPSGNGTDVTVLFWGDPANSTITAAAVGAMDATGVGNPAVISEWLSSAWGTGLYVRTTRSGLAPLVDAYPAASATYRGRTFRINGGAGVADQVATCTKDAANAYAWKTAMQSPAFGADVGDTGRTLTARVSAETQQWATPFTGTHAAILSTTGAVSGDHFHIVRKASASGAFNLNVGTGPLKALVAGEWCTVEFDGTAWILTAFGGL